jgi:lysine 2,3-aminomutase
MIHAMAVAALNSVRAVIRRRIVCRAARYSRTAGKPHNGLQRQNQHQYPCSTTHIFTLAIPGEPNKQRHRKMVWHRALAAFLLSVDYAQADDIKRTSRMNKADSDMTSTAPKSCLADIQTKVLRNSADLAEAGLIDAKNRPQLEAVGQRFAIAITPTMADLIDPQNPGDPIAKQFIPDIRELNAHPLDQSDPIGDQPHSPVTGIVHRYPDRLLLMPVKVCPVYCRFCFRRETVSNPEHALLSDDELDTALNYIRSHDEIWEVILSGGDPLLLSPRRLTTIISALNEMEHVGVIRIHTRVPVVDPKRVSSVLLDALQSKTAVYVVLHTNHPQELTNAARTACAQIVDAGIPMLSQTVLLKDINDDPETLEALFRQLITCRVKPYYLHHADRAPGTAHFRTTIKKGRAIMQTLRSKVSGICQPTYVLDIPGGAGKVPLEPEFVAEESPSRYKVRDHRGLIHEYDDTLTP